jgi:nucleotide-binding universal stress UspA family protein
VRGTLERWGLLEKGSPRSDVFEKLAIKVEKVDICCSSKPINEILDYLTLHPTDLIMLATQGRKGLPSWVHLSTAERIARGSKAMTLYVHGTEDGFVSLKDGALNVRRVLVPIDFHPAPMPAITYAVRTAGFMSNPVEIILLHVGDAPEIPTVEIPETKFCTWQTVQRRGKVVEEITKAAAEYAVNIIVMSTPGHEGFSVTERVLRQVTCPVLAVPAI